MVMHHSTAGEELIKDPHVGVTIIRSRSVYSTQIVHAPEWMWTECPNARSFILDVSSTFASFCSLFLTRYFSRHIAVIYNLAIFAHLFSFEINCSNCEVYLTVYLHYVTCNKEGFTAPPHFLSHIFVLIWLFWASLLCLSCSLPLGETHLRVNDIHRQGDHLTVNISDLVSCQHLPDMQHHIISHTTGRVPSSSPSFVPLVITQ